MTIPTNNLLILGDSFCSDRTSNTDWPIIVQESLSMNLQGQGFPGASWWSVRNSLVQHLEALPKIAIFCHTEPNRLPNNDDWGLNPHSGGSGLIHKFNHADQAMSAEFQLACKLYYKHLVCLEHNEWAMTRWLCELDELTKDIEIVLHFFGFNNIHRQHKFQHGVSFSDALINYTTMTLGPGITNHFDVATNQRFANVVLEYIHNYPGPGVRIDRKLDLC